MGGATWKWSAVICGALLCSFAAKETQGYAQSFLVFWRENAFYVNFQLRIGYVTVRRITQCFLFLDSSPRTCVWWSLSHRRSPSTPLLLNQIWWECGAGVPAQTLQRFLPRPKDEGQRNSWVSFHYPLKKRVWCSCFDRPLQNSNSDFFGPPKNVAECFFAFSLSHHCHPQISCSSGFS